VRAYAVKIGSIDLPLNDGRCLTLDNVLFVPLSSVCLVSIASGKSEFDFLSDFFCPF
jgi:hypothetical protein